MLVQIAVPPPAAALPWVNVPATSAGTAAVRNVRLFALWLVPM